jgi:hypothetical protein
LIITTTALRLHPENETRLISLTLQDTRRQTRSILNALASPSPADAIDLEPWLALQRWLASSPRPEVIIPFADTIVRLMPDTDIRLRRDVEQALNLVRTHALLHQATRDRDGEGRILATIDDYAAIHDLVAPSIAEGLRMSASCAMRETVDAVRRLMDQKGAASVQEVADVLGVDKSSASRRCAAASEAGYIYNKERSPGRTARYVLDGDLPTDTPVLPSPDSLTQALFVAGSHACAVALPLEGTIPPLPTPSASPPIRRRRMTI